MTYPLVQAIVRGLKNAANPSRARQMQAYMKSEMPFRGVNAPQQRLLWRSAFAAHPVVSPKEWRAVVLTLWRTASYREERYAAIGLATLKKYVAYRTKAAVPMFEEMIVTGGWWDYVDAAATHGLGDVLRADPEHMKPLMRRWARSKNMWKRRAAILCQIRLKAETDHELLYACIEPNLVNREFFIRKAIGWALRQYAWTNPGGVGRYVAANRAKLSPLSVREALKNL
jgi:3-methyladenine DNA glycosylase AlkD